MKRLLSKQSARALGIIEHLYGKEWVISETIASAINCSERTLRSDIKYINHLIFPVVIRTSLKTGLKLVIPASHSIKYVYSLLIQDSQNFIILETLFFNSFENLDRLAEVVFQSHATLYRSINYINTIVIEKGFTISMAQPIQIIGEEHAILAFFRSYFFEKYNDEMPVNRHVFEDILHKINAFYQLGNPRLFSFNLNVVTLYVLIRAIRLKQSPTNLFSKRLAEVPVTEAVRKLNCDLSKSVGLTFYHDFYSDIWCYTDGQQFFLSYEAFLEGLRQPTVQAEYDRLWELVTAIDSALTVPLARKEQFVFSLYTINLREQLISSIIVDQSQVMLENVKRQSPYLYTKFSHVLKGFVKKYPDFNQENLFYNVISAFENFWELSYLNQPRVRIALYSKYNDLTFKNNFRLIQSSLDKLVSVSLFFSYEDMTSLTDGYDLIITDISGLVVEGTEIICIPYDIKLDELAKVEAFCYDFLQKSAE